MATQTIVTLVDDLDGSEATESVSFALDGASYEIDLSDTNADKLRDALAGYVASARRVDGARRGPGRPPKAAKTAKVARGARTLRTASRPQPSASGPEPTATKFPSAAGCPPACWPPSRQRTDLIHTRLAHRVRHLGPRSASAAGGFRVRRFVPAEFLPTRECGCRPFGTADRCCSPTA